MCNAGPYIKELWNLVKHLLIACNIFLDNEVSVNLYCR